MLTPPATSLTPWRPGYWITQTGYALTQVDMSNGVKDDKRFNDMSNGVKDDKRFNDMQNAVNETKRILEKVMGK